MAVEWRALASWGFSCFPLTPRDKRPFGPWQRFQSAAPTEEELGNWARRPDLNGAVVCGRISGILVLDTDSPEADAEAQRRGIPTTPTVRTSKGHHYYFRHPGREVRNFAGKLPGMDLRGDGGYVVAAGSVHPSGHVYGWVHSPVETELADPPAWLLDLVDLPPPPPLPSAGGSVVAGPWQPAPSGNAYAEAAMDKELGRLRRAGEGTRNDTLNECAYNLGQLVAGGALGQAEVERSLLTIALMIGLAEKEARATIGSGMKAGAAQPRSAPDPRPGSRPPPSPRLAAAAPRAPQPPEAFRANEGGGEAGGDGSPDPGGGGDGCPYTALGQRGGDYFVLAASGEVRRLSIRDLSTNGLLSIFNGDPAWLIDQFPRFNKEGERIADWALKPAVGDLMRRCARAGLWDEDTPVRTLGVWRHGEQLLVHCGDAVQVDGAWRPAGRRLGSALYPAAPVIARPSLKPATQEEAQALAAHLRLWSIKQRAGRTLLFGWLAVALLGAAPRWRPHFLVSGERGCGKSSLATLIDAALGPQSQMANNYTEAGIRQALTNQGRGLVLDEAEGDTGRVQALIELLRQMSGGDGVQGIRGSVGHGAQRFSLSGAVFMAAINAPMLEPQDRSRITEVELLKPPEDPLAADKVEQATLWAAERSAALRARAIAGWSRFQANLQMLRSLLIERGCDGRQADQLGTLLAAGAMLHNDLPLDTDSASLIADKVEGLIFRLRSEDEEDSDPRRCLGTLLTTQIDHWRGGNKSTVGRILMEGLRDVEVDARMALRTYGMRVELGGLRFREGECVVEVPGPVLVVANSHEALSRFFRDKPWRGGGWTRALLRLPGARAAPPLRYDGHKARGVIIPADLLPTPVTPGDDVLSTQDG